MPIEATIRMPVEITGDKPGEAHCRARVVHAKADAFSDGRMGYGAEIEAFIEPEKPKPPRTDVAKPNVAIPSSLSRNTPGGVPKP